jgi:hypothetical protein
VKEILVNIGTVMVLVAFAVFLVSPFVSVALFGFAKNQAAVDLVDRIAAWFENRNSNLSKATGAPRRLAKFVLWPFVVLNRQTARIQNKMTQAGVRVVASAALACVLVCVVAILSIVLLTLLAYAAIAAVAIFFGYRLLVGNDGSSTSNSGSKDQRGLFRTECGTCGSKEHTTSDCPHGLFSSECGNCGSKNHATNDCPHGLISSKCGTCGSTDHATNNCPHGFISSECGNCGSKNHATSDCPHGFVSSKCRNCGSKDHATSDCPH